MELAIQVCLLCVFLLGVKFAFGSNQTSLTEMQEKLDSMKDTLDTLTAVDTAAVLADFAKELDKAGLCFGDLRTEVENIGGVFWNATSCDIIGIKLEGEKIPEALRGRADAIFTTASGHGVSIKHPKPDAEDKDTEESATNSSVNVDVVLLSHKLKKGKFGYNNVVGQVKNIGVDTVDFVKIGLTVYDKNRDVVGTDSAYSESSTLKSNQKSSFDILSNKDNFDGMESYELSLQWQGPDGTDEYVDNTQIYED